VQARHQGPLIIAASICAVAAAPPVASDPAPAEWSPERSELEARNLLNRWLRAQNGGDSDAYAALYSERFEGVRSSAGTATRVDRDKWLGAEKRSFAAPMRVQLFFVDVSAAGDSAEVSFVQSRDPVASVEASARNLTLQRLGDRFLIASDKIRMSRQLPREARSSANWFRVDDAGDVILWEGNVAPPWLPAKLELKRTIVETTTELQVAADVPWRSLPPALSRLASRQVQIVSAKDARSCQLIQPVISKKWIALSTVVADMSKDALAAFLMDDQIEPWTLHVAVPECDGLNGVPAFARLDEGEIPQRVIPRAASRTVAKEALARFKKLPPWPTVSGKGGGATRTVEVALPLPDGSLRLVALTYRSANPGCAAWALWKVGDPAETDGWELLNDPADLTDFYPRLVTDLDGDGKPELFGSGASTAGPPSYDRSWSASGVRPVDGSVWVPFSASNCDN
jgi:hypothetical protein